MTFHHPASSQDADVIIVGAGSSGLTAGYYLQRQGLRVLLLEATPRRRRLVLAPSTAAPQCPPPPVSTAGAPPADAARPIRQPR